MTIAVLAGTIIDIVTTDRQTLKLKITDIAAEKNFQEYCFFKVATGIVRGLIIKNDSLPYAVVYVTLSGCYEIKYRLSDSKL